MTTTTTKPMRGSAPNYDEILRVVHVVISMPGQAVLRPRGSYQDGRLVDLIEYPADELDRYRACGVDAHAVDEKIL